MEGSENGGDIAGNEKVRIIDPNIELAHKLLSRQPVATEANLEYIYRTNQAESKVQEIGIVTDKPSVNILFLSELLLGHQHAALDFFVKTVESLKELPEDMRPDVLVMSGLLQGDFKFLDKRRRTTLVPELTSMGEQFRYGRELINLLLSTGIPLIYNLSNDDRQIAEEYTIEVFRKMQKYAQKKGKEKDHDLAQSTVNYADVDKMRQNSQWNTHLKFQIEVVFPYCLRSGRRLRSAEEMRRLTEGKVHEEEYFLLFDAMERLNQGRKLSKTQRKWLEVENLKDTEFHITDDANLTIKTADRSYTDKIRHNMGFSQKPMYSNHMNVMVHGLQQMRANGLASHNFTITQHSQEAVGVDLGDGMWGISTGGFIRAKEFFDTKGSKVDVPGDISRRLVSTRRRIPSPGATAHMRTDDGRHIVTIFNEALRDKSYSIPERMAIVLFCDWQTGSITARPDYQVKFMDYVHSRTLQESPVAIFVGGDIVHGRNYPDFASESQSSMLMSMESQIEFVKTMMERVLEGLTPQQVAGIVRVIVEPGNHEWNSGTVKWHGESFTRWLRDLYTGMYTRNGLTKEKIEEIVKFHNAVVTPKGEFFKSWTGLDYFGNNGISVQHFALERGAKGGLGGLPVYQAHDHSAGIGKLKASIDYELYGHWHHPQYALFGDKLAIVGGSLAGISGYEWWRGYRPVISGTILHIGGSLPPQIEFVSEEALIRHKIKEGRFSDANLLAEKYETDRNFDPIRHGPFLPDQFPKSALQKALDQIRRDASQSANSFAKIKEPRHLAAVPQRTG